MSFWKHDPPKPTEERRNLLPILTSLPTARATSSTSACVTSQSCEIALIEEMRCARNLSNAREEERSDGRVRAKSCKFHPFYLR